MILLGQGIFKVQLERVIFKPRKSHKISKINICCDKACSVVSQPLDANSVSPKVVHPES